MLLGVAMQLVTIGMYGGSASAVVPRLVSIVITIGVSKGLSSRSQIAWHLGRILNLLALILGVFMVVTALGAQFHGISRLTFLAWLAIALIESAFIFFALGARDVRMFCGIKAKREAAQHHPGP